MSPDIAFSFGYQFFYLHVPVNLGDTIIYKKNHFIRSFDFNISFGGCFIYFFVAKIMIERILPFFAHLG